VLVVRDVTAERRFARERDEFVLRASHELRTPLTGLRMALDILGERAHFAADSREADLMREFSVGRAILRKVLSRIQQEGWIERRPGHGLEFLPTIDSVEAYEESYALRLAVEPAGLLSPKFRPNRVLLDACRKQQEFIAGAGYRTMTPIELFEANARFHETIAEFSGNRFFVQTVRRMDQLRRLVEYMQAEHRLPRKEQAVEHLAILDAIATGDYLDAATKMREHLDGARRAKTSLFSGLSLTGS